MVKLPSLKSFGNSSIGSRPEGKDCQISEDALQVLPNLVCSSFHENGRVLPTVPCGDCDVREKTSAKRGEIPFNGSQQANILPTIPESKSFDTCFQSKQKHSQSSLSSLYQQSLQSKNSMAFWRRIDLQDARSKPKNHEDTFKMKIFPYIEPLRRPNKFA